MSSLTSYVEQNKAKRDGFSKIPYIPLPTKAPEWSESAKKFISSWSSSSLKTSSANGVETSPTEQPQHNGGMFSRMSSAIKGEDACGMTRVQRMVGFVVLFLCGCFCFGLASMYIPILVLKARKFCALYSLGSVCFILSFSLLWGPWVFAGHLCSSAKLPVTATYFGTLFATLYASLWLQSTLLTIICVSAQVVSWIWFVFSFVPGGETGLRFIGRSTSALFRRSTGVKTTLPV